MAQFEPQAKALPPAQTRRHYTIIRNAVVVWFLINLVFQLIATTAMREPQVAFFDRLADHARTASATYTFALLSTIAIAVSVVAIFWARPAGHALTGLIGALMVVAGLGTTLTDLPVVLAVALLIFGVAAVTLAWRSWQGGRAAWAFSIALDGVLALVTLFGAPKVRGLLHIDIWMALVPTTLAIAATAALATLASRYDSEAGAAAPAASR